MIKFRALLGVFLKRVLKGETPPLLSLPHHPTQPPRGGLAPYFMQCGLGSQFTPELASWHGTCGKAGAAGSLGVRGHGQAEAPISCGRHASLEPELSAVAMRA